MALGILSVTAAAQPFRSVGAKVGISSARLLGLWFPVRFKVND
jgi:hypothetical protein